MSKDKRLKYFNSDDPGPGAYDSPSKLGKAPKYTMGNKSKGAIDNKIPGPGSYNNNVDVVKDKIISHKIIGSKREDFLNKYAA